MNLRRGHTPARDRHSTLAQVSLSDLSSPVRVSTPISATPTQIPVECGPSVRARRRSRRRSGRRQSRQHRRAPEDCHGFEQRGPDTPARHRHADGHLGLGQLASTGSATAVVASCSAFGVPLACGIGATGRTRMVVGPSSPATASPGVLVDGRPRGKGSRPWPGSRPAPSRALG